MKKQLTKKIALSLLSIGVVMTSGASQAQSEREQDCAQRCKGHGFKKPRFIDLDIDGDSFVTLSEFMEKPIPHGDHETVFGHIDADGNGEITQEEFDSHRPPPHPKRQVQSGRTRG